MSTLPKNFIAIRDSLISKEWYQKILKPKTSSGIGYTFFLRSLIGLVITVYLTVIFYVNVIPSKIAVRENSFPENLTVIIHNGQVAINQPTPYTIPIFDSKIVIDTESAGSPDDFTKSGAGVLVTKDYIVYKDDVSYKNNNKIVVLPIKELPFSSDLTINKAWVSQMLTTMISFAWVLPLIWFLIFITLFTFGIFFTSLIYALFVWLVLRCLKKSVSYHIAYTVTLYARTAPLILGAMGRWVFGWEFLAAWWFGLPLTIGIIIYMYYPSHKNVDLVQA